MSLERLLPALALICNVILMLPQMAVSPEDIRT